MDLLVDLAGHAETTVSREDLHTRVWGDAFVVDGVIAKAVSALRSALGDDARDPVYIQTVTRRGYQLLVAPEPLPDLSSETRQSTQSLAVGVVEANRPRSGPPSSEGASAVSPTKGRIPFRHSRLGWPTLLVTLLGAGLVAFLISRDTAPNVPDNPIERLIVTPFDGITLDPEFAYLPRSLGEEVADQLVRIGDRSILWLPSSYVDWSSVEYRALRADAVLTGSVEMDGETVRLWTRLFDGAGRELLWSRTFERPLSAIRELRTEIAHDVVEHLGRDLSEINGGRLLDRRPVVPEAYDHYLRARYFWSLRRTDALWRARDLFDRVIEEDPLFADGFASQAMFLVTAGNYHLLPTDEAWARAGTAAHRALTLAPESSLANTAAGLVAINRDVAHYRAALAVAPGDPLIHQYLAEALSIGSQHDEALAMIDEAIALEPFSPVHFGVRAIVNNSKGDWAQVLLDSEQTDLLNPGFAWHRVYAACALERLGRVEESVEVRIQHMKDLRWSQEAIDSLVAAVGRAGSKGYWEWELSRLEGSVSEGNSPNPTQLGAAYAASGRIEEALAQLENARSAGGEYFLHRRRCPAFDSVRDTAEYRQLLDDFQLDDL
jgi:DNA-binding winged helix-turn-helix (wHTH) protein/TolB-like protein